ncbi:MAG: tetratricopeptide repeat protein [Flavobacteriales bacterium]|nr:tetratricopeptide repeat protein [Flavobacteriales bacterium]
MKYALLLPVIALLAACGGPKADSPAEVSARIRTMEDSVFQSLTFDQRKAQALLDVYKAYANANPTDTASAEYLFRAANVAKTMHDGEQSIALYDRVIKDFPSWRRLPDVLYLKAFTIDSELDRKGEAETAYREVIDRYPDHPFAKDARVIIENLQYTDEESIERFQAMNDSTAVLP